MEDSSLMFRSGLLLVLAIAVIGGAARLLGIGDGAGVDRAVATVATQADTGQIGARQAAAPSAEPCRIAAPGRPLPAEVRESSGVAVSRRHQGVLWTHNDSGDPVLYAVGSDGRLRGRTLVQGATLRDWEDLAIGPCQGGDCLYIGDIGDNDAARPSVTVYRVPEPAPGERQTGPAEALHARYPDGPHDAEAMFVLPTGEIYVLTKGEKGPIVLYRFPADAAPGRTVQLERVRELAAGEVDRSARVTGADASPDGRWVAVRTRDALSFYPARELLGGGEPGARHVDLKPLQEAQGEAVSFAADGSVVLTSEGGSKESPATFARLACELP